MLHVLPPNFKPVNNLIWCKTGLICNSFCSKNAKQVECFLLPIFPYLKQSELFSALCNAKLLGGKMLMSLTFLVKFQVFKEYFSKTKDTRLTSLAITDIAMLFNYSKILLV